MSKSPVTGSRMLGAILKAVAFADDVAAEEIVGRGNARNVTRARQHFMAQAYETGCWSLPQIGAFLGRDHTTVLFGVRAHKARCGA